VGGECAERRLKDGIAPYCKPVEWAGGIAQPAPKNCCYLEAVLGAE
jgi:hypothetical protein